MKNLLFTLLVISISEVSFATDTVVFEDDFESGMINWIPDGTWDLTTEDAQSPTHSITESPSGDYGSNLDVTFTKLEELDFTEALGADITFWVKYDIEANWDFLYIEVSQNGGDWQEVDAITGNSDWIEKTVDLSPYVGGMLNIRFRFISDSNTEENGSYIDDIVITTNDNDVTAPTIIHEGAFLCEATLDDFEVEAEVTDISGVSSVALTYAVDGGDEVTINPYNNISDTYYFLIPAQEAGAIVYYDITAEDNLNNSGNSESYSYVSGHHLIYDSGVADMVTLVGPDAGSSGVAVRITIPTGVTTNIVSGLIRTFCMEGVTPTDMEVHIWDDNSGIPGFDLITPFLVTPESTLENNNVMTKIDLRPYADQLSNMEGDFYIGFVAPFGEIWMPESAPASFTRTFFQSGGQWYPNVNIDVHFRAVDDTPQVDIDEDNYQLSIVNYQLKQNYPNPFNPVTKINYELRITNYELAEIVVHNSAGQQVWSSPITDHGSHITGSILFNGSAFNSGIYYYSLVVDGKKMDSKPMILIK